MTTNLKHKILIDELYSPELFTSISSQFQPSGEACPAFKPLDFREIEGQII